jgi:membrane associated rhomboid family serine protease
MDPIAARMTPSIKALVILNAVVYSFYIFVTPVRPLMIAHLALGPGLFDGQLWQPLTALFVHFDVLQFVFDLIGLWFVGAFIERTQGTRRFLTLFFSAGLLANLAVVGVWHLRGFGAVYDGCSLPILAIFVAYGRIFGRASTQVLGSLFVQARYLAMFWVGWAVLASLMSRNWGLLAGTLVATAIGYLLAAPGGLRELATLWRTWRGRRRYRVLDGGAPRRGRAHKYWN